MAQTNTEERRLNLAARLAALTLANAFIAQAELADVDPHIRPLRETLAERDPVNALVAHWQYICDTIDYVPIFYLAKQVLLLTPPRHEVYQSLRKLGDEVLTIVAERAALRHDLMGRIYHRLLLEAKYLGTFYTSVPAATLLLKLALSPERWNIDWSSVEALSQFRVADLACGTGTLLMAAQQTITDNFIRTSASIGKPVDAHELLVLHQALMQEILYGYDVLSSAVHLTASTLALLAPEIAFRKMHLYCMPLGEQLENLALGSIEFLTRSSIPTQLDFMGEAPLAGSATAVTGSGNEASQAPLPKLDLCVMNPPFVRSVGGNLLFGSLPGDVRHKMQTKLRDMLNTPESSGQQILASSTAGLGSVFVAVANPHMKTNGRLALVLPEALASGVAWEKTRQLFARDYALELLVVSHDPDQWNFSENTKLSEILIVARKLAPDEERTTSLETTCVNLWRNTKTPIDALALADAILHSEAADIESATLSGSGVASVIVNGSKRGELVKIPWMSMMKDQWYPCAFAQTDLIRVAHFLRKGRSYFPVKGAGKDLPLIALSSIGVLGPDRRDIFDGFSTTNETTSYPAFWSHDAATVTSLEMSPNMFLSPRSSPLPRRPARPVGLLWPRAGRIMLAERMRLNTQRLIAVHLPQLALSNVWWPLRLREDSKVAEKILVLWLNSTLGLISLLSYRVPTEGSWVQFKKPTLEKVPVLDASKLSPESINQLVSVYDQMANSELAPLSQMASDSTRILIDNAIAQALDLSPFDVLRETLAREPMLSGKPL